MEMFEMQGRTRGVFVGVAVLAALFLCPVIAGGRELLGGDEMLRNYFRAETAKLEADCLADIDSLEQWQAKRGEYRRQLMEMLGLYPEPERTSLNAVTTGRLEHEDFVVEKVHFQSLPGFYVTGNLYLPKEIKEPLPAVLYVCGHGHLVKDDICYGNKVGYQHHPAWFARNGYVSLIIDTIQWCEIRGIHHGTFTHNRWWWNSRGYTPAGVEAWNCVRALDYLQNRSEVDGSRLGVTGRSGGGAYSWWIAAIDERIKAAVPTAGITDLQNQVVAGDPAGPHADGCVEGHCDCMFMVNTYRWDFPLVSALVAPRALLIANSDKDDLFPLDGLVRLHEKTRKIYRLYGAGDKLGINITEGPHRDTQQLRVHAFSWFNRFLKGDNPLIEKEAMKFFEADDLKVFDTLPTDEINSEIDEHFVPKAEPAQVPANQQQWVKMRNEWMKALNNKSFAGWPCMKEAAGFDVEKIFSAVSHGVELTAYDFTSQHDIRLRLFVAKAEGVTRPERLTIKVLDESQWGKWVSAMSVAFAEPLGIADAVKDTEAFESFRQRVQDGRAVAWVTPRGIGLTSWNPDPRKRVQIRRRFMLLGQTLDGMRVWDVRRAIQAIRMLEPYRDIPTSLEGAGVMAGIAMYASLYEPGIDLLELYELPASHLKGPIFLNVLKYLDMPAAAAMVAERSFVRIYQQGGSEQDWGYSQEVAQKLGWHEQRVQIVTVTEQD